MIPKILHRVIPYKTTELMDKSWESVLNNLNGWQFVTHYDDETLPMTKDYLHLCPHGAFRADLIRLESLYIMGGVYLDSDIELIKPIDHLLDNNFFAVRESQEDIANSVIGSTVGSEILLDAINLSIEVLKNVGLNKNDNYVVNGTHKSFGPYVITEVLKKYPNVNILNTKTFFPYLYNQKHLASADYSKDRRVLGVHRWAGSWLND
jgi:mannosyltransferase OCH1-like enzyme